MPAGQGVFVTFRKRTQRLSRELRRDRSLEHRPNLLITCRRSYRSVPLEDSSRICVHHEHLVLARIKQHRIRGLRANPVQPQKFPAKLRRRTFEHPLQRSPVELVHVPDEGFQPPRLLSKKSSRPDQLFQHPDRQLANALHAQGPGLPQLRQGQLHICPCRVLRQDRSRNHFKRRFGGPPVLTSPRPIKGGEVNPD